MFYLPPPDDLLAKAHQELSYEYDKVRREKDLLTKACIVLFCIVTACFVLMAAINDRPVNINFTPELYRYTYSNILQNHIQAGHTYHAGILQNGKMISIEADDYGDLYGDSMQPTFFEGHTVLLKNMTNLTAIRTGDMLRFFRLNENETCSMIVNGEKKSQLGGSWINNSLAVIHRVAAYYDDDSIMMQGDNLYEQEVIKKCQVTHQVVGIIFT